MAEREKDIVAVVDGGGRGAVLSEAYANSPYVRKVLVFPGNDTIPAWAGEKVKVFPRVKTTDVMSILQICDEEKVDLVDVAQDNAIQVGLVDALATQNILTVGRSYKAGE